MFKVKKISTKLFSNINMTPDVLKYLTSYTNFSSGSVDEFIVDYKDIMSKLISKRIYDNIRICSYTKIITDSKFFIGLGITKYMRANDLFNHLNINSDIPIMTLVSYHKTNNILNPIDARIIFSIVDEKLKTNLFSKKLTDIFASPSNPIFIINSLIDNIIDEFTLDEHVDIDAITNYIKNEIFS